MSVMHQNTTIANGASAGDEIDISERVVIGIEVPSVWTTATISFEAAQKSPSKEGGTWVPVFDAAGTELEVQAAPSRLIVIAPDATRAFRFLRLRSGPSTLRVNQGADRILNVATALDITT